tara:strand:- start:43827 stop:44414 length:588 start_codon:yes stop_codon:yes gene_type:complete
MSNKDLSNKDFRINKDTNSAFGKAMQQHQQQQQLESDNRKDKVIDVKGKKYIIKRWSNVEALRKLPMVANLLFVPAAAPMLEAATLAGDEPELSAELFNAADLVTVLYDRMMQAGFAEFIADLLDEVYVRGKDVPVDIDEDFDSVLDIVPVVLEVLQANFMMQLCRDLLQMIPQSLNLQEMATAMNSSQHTSEKQ